MARWVYADADVLARVETLRRGDRIYLPGRHAHGPGRVVSHLEEYDAHPGTATVPALPARVVVVYFTGERHSPLARELHGATLVTKSLRWLPRGERIRCRRAVPA